MRLSTISAIGLLAILPWLEAGDSSAVIAQESPAARGPQVEQIMIPIYGRGRLAAPEKAYWGSLGGGEVFREIHALSREGLVQNAGQGAPKLRVLEEFFAPAASQAQSTETLLGHYVYIVECVRSEVKHVVAVPQK